MKLKLMNAREEVASSLFLDLMEKRITAGLLQIMYCFNSSSDLLCLGFGVGLNQNIQFSIDTFNCQRIVWILIQVPVKRQATSMPILRFIVLHPSKSVLENSETFQHISWMKRKSQ